VFFGLGSLLGAPYLPIRRQDREELLDLVDLKPGQTIIDLGSGDGTLLKAAAKRGLRVVGYEINPVLWLISLVRCFKYRKLVSVRLGNFWNQKLPQAEVIYVFLIDRYMEKLKRKLESEIKSPTAVVSYVFELPAVAPIKKTHNAYIYRCPFDS
jgi:16S rRNA A1518/A1519 N6-dimethyltransferase RsmA/KsgA/DIM1 with predicted DNA glycosylase/AP lyase activity